MQLETLIHPPLLTAEVPGLGAHQGGTGGL